MATTAPARQPQSFQRALGIAGLLVIVDAFALNQGLVSLLFGFWVIVIVLPLAFLPKFRATRRERLRNVGIYLLAVAAVVGVNRLNNFIAARRAEYVIEAVKAFHAQNGRYPRSLDALVPAFLTAVPRAKYTLTFGHFTYTTTASGAMLYYVALPPYRRPAYDFGTGAWRYVD